MDNRKQTIIATLGAWIRQRPGLEFGNYGDVRAYRAEIADIGRDLKHARELLHYVEQCDAITADDLIHAAKHSYSGRLSIAETDDGVRIDYCTGQYWPTEYRRAVCAVLVSAIWHHWRERMVPVPCAWRVRAWGPRDTWKDYSTEADAIAARDAAGGRSWGCVDPVYRLNGRALTAGDYLRSFARRVFGASIGRRWFN